MEVLDENALAIALRKKQIAGIELDVFEQKPRIYPAQVQRKFYIEFK